MGDWIEWKGGGQPCADDVQVDVRFRCGVSTPGEVAGDWEWRHAGGGYDIVAYRVVVADYRQEGGMTTMTERVARAIKAKVPLGYGMTEAEAGELARAAIEAMREPSDAMFSAAAPFGLCMSALDDAYDAMIDAALSESSQ